MRNTHFVNNEAYHIFVADKPVFKPPTFQGAEFGEPSVDLLNEEKRAKVIALIKSGFVDGF